MIAHYIAKAIGAALIVLAFSVWGMPVLYFVAALTFAYLIGFRIVNGYWEQHPAEIERQKKRKP